MTDQIFTLVKDISIPGVFAIALIVVAKPLIPALNDLIKSKIWKSQQVTDEHMDAIDNVNSSVKLLGSNHMHELKDLLSQVLQSQSRSERSLESIKESLIYLRARLNGKQ